MRTPCPSPETLVEQALCPPPETSETAQHLRECESCHGEIARLRETAAGLNRASFSTLPTEADCLTDEAIAARVEGLSAPDSAEQIAHLSSCARCRARLSAVHTLLAAKDIAAELEHLETVRAHTPRFRRAHVVIGGFATLAAASIAVLLFPPVRTAVVPVQNPGVDRLHREGGITTTSAPRIVRPAGFATASDTLIWTRVPHADRYQVKVYDRDGTLLFDQATPDTMFAMPAQLLSAQAKLYVWKVWARTGWDRWVESEWGEFAIDPKRAKQ